MPGERLATKGLAGMAAGGVIIPMATQEWSAGVTGGRVLSPKNRAGVAP